MVKVDSLPSRERGIVRLEQQTSSSNDDQSKGRANLQGTSTTRAWCWGGSSRLGGSSNTGGLGSHTSGSGSRCGGGDGWDLGILNGEQGRVRKVSAANLDQDRVQAARGDGIGQGGGSELERRSLLLAANSTESQGALGIGIRLLETSDLNVQCDRELETRGRVGAVVVQLDLVGSCTDLFVFMARKRVMIRFFLPIISGRSWVLRVRCFA